jgi:hypothetical protein
MEPAPPRPHEAQDEPRGQGVPGGSDAFARLEARLDRASKAAERLISEAAAEATQAAARLGERPKPPPQGWQTPNEPPPASGGELDALIALAESVRELVPPDLRRRLGEAIKELLLAIRAFIDWYVERLEQRRGDDHQVEDIPVI